MILQTWDFSKSHNSTKIPTDEPNEYNINLKEDTSITKPSFMLSLEEVPVFNYCKYMFWYFYVEDIIFISKNLYEVQCSLDVLATYREDILGSTQYVLRSASNYNVNIRDSEISPTLLQDKTVIDTQNAVLDDLGCYLFRCIGKGTANNFRSFGISTYIMSPIEIANVIKAAFDNQIFNQSSGFDIDDIAQLLKCFFLDPAAYVVGVNWVPVDVDSVITERVHLGYYDTNVDAQLLQQDEVIGTNSLNNYSRYFNDFRDFDTNYTQFEISIPCVGIIPLNPADVYAGISIATYVELLTGTITYYLYKTSNSASIGKYKTNVNSNVQIGGVTHGINTGSITSLISSLFSDELHPQTGIIGNIGSKVEAKHDYNFRLTRRIFGSTQYPTTNKGRPLCEYKTLNTLSGYCECREPLLSTTAYGEEKNQIIDYMTNGFIIE